MAMSVTYTTINGVIVHEALTNNRERELTSDPLGSLVKIRTSVLGYSYSAEYWPYGEIQSQTGSNPTRWAFVGLLGYMRDLATMFYVRARYYRSALTRWMTMDPLWPGERAYSYANSKPLTHMDPSGLAVIPILCVGACIAAGGCAAGVWIACGKLWGEPEFGECVADYISSLPIHSQIGCLVGIAGCLACIIGLLRKCINKKIGCNLAKAMKEACCYTSRACNTNDDCNTLRRKLAIRKCCHDGRLYIGRLCFGGSVNYPHTLPIVEEAKGIRRCLTIMAMPSKKCALI